MDNEWNIIRNDGLKGRRKSVGRILSVEKGESVRDKVKALEREKGQAKHFHCNKKLKASSNKWWKGITSTYISSVKKFIFLHSNSTSHYIRSLLAHYVWISSKYKCYGNFTLCTIRSKEEVDTREHCSWKAGDEKALERIALNVCVCVVVDLLQKIDSLGISV